MSMAETTLTRDTMTTETVPDAARKLIEDMVAGKAPMSRWMGSVDYSTYEEFEEYLKAQLREKLTLKVSLDKKRNASAEDESLATFVDGASGVLESVLVTFRTVRERASRPTVSLPDTGVSGEVSEASFADWWSKNGQYLDPDTDDVPWFDKRRGLAEYAFHAGARSQAWPDFIAPAQYENAGSSWTDPELPDFRKIWDAAKSCGYVIGLHGSMKRDCDLIAAPWTEYATDPETLIGALCRTLNAKEVGEREDKPLGRIAVNLQIDGWFKLIDLSIAPALARRARDPASSDEAGIIEKCAAIADELARAYGDGVLLSSTAIALRAQARTIRDAIRSLASPAQDKSG